ncbi:hypothetical protein A1F97_04527 [Pyrenophora tritici-repentis]|nr:hypothetical protein Alg215_08510 [Pyrenophora tritici-repentis]KAI1539394.1 hypothetical protein PtrSN001A_004584 [Pyrenophora tritici-repentis]PZD26948.1 hypothetical protein A1F96_07154 [Pyrenophora tritici-repentis]PZD41236.1 hypothetical protein A1F97_04527 [Pyrenophora tritici-repentis]
MVGYKRILSAMLSRGVKGSKVNKSPDNNDNTTDGNIATTPASVFSISPHMAHKRERLAHVVTGLGQQYCDTSTPMSSSSATDATPSSLSSTTQALTIKKRFRLGLGNRKIHDPSTPPSTADATMVESEAAKTFGMCPSNKLTIDPLTPPATVRSESPNEDTEAVADTSKDTHVTDITHNATHTPTNVTTSVNVRFNTSEDVNNNLDAHDAEMEAALAAMRAAEELLNQRHAAIKQQPNTGKRMKPLDIINKIAGQRASSAPVQVPCDASAIVQPRAQQSTANEAIEAMRRREAMKDLAYFAANGCPSNIAIIEQMNEHFGLQQYDAEGNLLDATFNVHGVTIRASQMPNDSIERLWIGRYNMMKYSAMLVEERALNEEDHEFIVAQILPQERKHLLDPEHFNVYMDSLAEEDIFTMTKAKLIAGAGVTVEEFDKGPHYIRKSGSKSNYHDPDVVGIFEIPQPLMRTITTDYTVPVTQVNLYPHLRTLVEAAVYKKNFWKGYFIPNPRSKLNDFFEAYRLTQENWLLPPSLTNYKRAWTHRESRLLQRGQYICKLLSQYEAKQITDFGIIRAIRATFIPIPGQPCWCAEDLEKFLYHRIVDSGIAISKIPEIILLHPDNDEVFSNPAARDHVREALQARMHFFKAEEAARLHEIQQSRIAFRKAQKKNMSKWARVKAGFKRRFGKKVVVEPFNPFDPSH